MKQSQIKPEDIEISFINGMHPKTYFANLEKKVLKAQKKAKKEIGIKYDNDKPRMDLITPEALWGLAKVLRYGANKYNDRNWERGIKYSRYYAALLRHVTAWWCGEELDAESGLHHLHHAATCLMFLQTYVERGKKDFDDRPKQ